MLIAPTSTPARASAKRPSGREAPYLEAALDGPVAPGVGAGADEPAVACHADACGLRYARMVDEAKVLRDALAGGRIRLYRQPIVAAVTGEVVRWECLARMVRPDGTVAEPHEFIPAAEQAGLIGDVDLVALDLVLAELARAPRRCLAVNVSAGTLADAGARGAYLDRLMAGPGVRGLTVEITETIAIDDFDMAARFAEAVRRLGVRVALDDFGEGHTSFRSLACLPLDEVKIDGLYVEQIDRRAQGQAFVRAIEGLSRDLGLETVAERVETRGEADQLRAMGIHRLQGYHFGAPTAL